MNDFEKTQHIVSIKGKANYRCALNTSLNCESGYCVIDKKQVYECKREFICPYYNKQNDAKRAQIMLTSYQYFLRAVDCSKWVTPRDVLIFDECHKFRSLYTDIRSLEISNKEIEVLEFIKTIYDGEIITNKRFKGINTKKKYKLDIFIPEFNLGIEYNGNNWHCESKIPEKFYHRNKRNFFKEQGIDVVFIYSHEWHNKKSIIKNIIKERLKKEKKIVYARKCTIGIPTKTEEKEFLDKYHLQGSVNSSNCIGLYYKEQLISVMTFGRNRFEDGGTELLRYCNSFDYKIIGGASKLLSHFLADRNFRNIN
jgi:hypothetical protein